MSATDSNAERFVQDVDRGQRCALVVVDMQNGFISPMQGPGVEGAAAVLSSVNRWVDLFRQRNWLITFTRDVDPFGHRGAEAEYNYALHPELDTSAGHVVDKGPGSRSGFSGFLLASTAVGGTAGGGGLSRLHELLRENSIDQLVVVGLAADVCVSATALDARRLGYAVTVDLEASAFVHADPRGDGAAMSTLRDAGVVVLDRGTGL